MRIKSQNLPLPIIRPLVLQPVSVARYAADLLPVIVGDWVLEGVGGGVDAVGFDAGVELFFFLHAPPSISVSLHELVRKGEWSLTAANSPLRPLFIALQIAPPRNGPTSQPIAPKPAVMSPRTTKGSSPKIWVPKLSRSWVERTEMPRPVVVRDVVIEEARL
jgi:hypothetical protein